MEQPRYPKTFYFAFISYKRADAKWANWLHKNLEHFQLPKKLWFNRSLPRKLYPCFLDTEELTSGMLTENLKRAIAESLYFISICSRNCRQNPQYIDMELQFFLETHNYDYTKVIPFIVEDSSQPEVDCFSPNMRQLNSYCHGLVGVNVKEKGKRTALLKVLAQIHNLKVTDLESRDRRRRKRKLYASVICIATVLVGSFAAHLIVSPKYQYFLDYTERWGIPQGIGELSKEEAQKTDSCYVIEKQFGRVKELRHVNFAGRATDYDFLDFPDRPVIARYSNTGEGENLQVEYQNEMRKTVAVLSYNADRSIVTIESEEGNTSSLKTNTTNSGEGLFSNENALGHGRIAGYVEQYDKNGYLKERHYRDYDYSPAGDGEGIWGIRYERDEKNRVITLTYLEYFGETTESDGILNASLYKPTANSYGVYGKEYEYDKKNRLVRIADFEIFEFSKFPALNENLWAECRITYSADKSGPIVTREYYDDEGNLALCADGYSMVKKTGAVNAPEYSYHTGKDGEYWRNTTEGYAFLNINYDKQGRIRFVSFQDCFRKPVVPQSGIFSSYTVSYENNDRRVIWHYADQNGKTAETDDGVSFAVFEYDTDGNLVLQEFLNKRKKLTIVTEFGNAGIKWEYKNGRLAKETMLGTAGLPAADINGVAEYEYEYDLRGNIKNILFLGEDGKICQSKEGIAGCECDYDSLGREIRRCFFSLDEKTGAWVESNCKNGFSRIEYSYDDGGRLHLQKLYDASGDAATHKTDHWSVEEHLYDDYGRETKRRFYGTDGETLVLGANGYAVCKTDYSAGNILMTSFFDTDYNPVSVFDGYAAYRYLYAEDGRCTGVVYYDEAGNAWVPESDKESVRENGEYQWIEAGNYITVLKYLGKDAFVTVPERINDKQVVAVEGDAFDNTGVQVIYFPDGIYKEYGFLKKVDLKSRTIHYTDGTSYQGGIDHLLPSGEGTLIDPSLGYRYRGEFKNGAFHGAGSCLFENRGDVYEGEFTDGELHGYGKMSYSNKSDGLKEYEGYWKNGFFHGYGVLTFTNGEAISGTWENGDFMETE